MPGWFHVHAWVRGAAIVLVSGAVVVGAPLSLAAASTTPIASQTGPTSMPGMTDGSMPGMTDGSMPGMADMPGMDHGHAASSGAPTAHPRALLLGGFALVNLVVLLAAAGLRRRGRGERERSRTRPDLVRNVP